MQYLVLRQAEGNEIFLLEALYFSKEWNFLHQVRLRSNIWSFNRIEHIHVSTRLWSDYFTTHWIIATLSNTHILCHDHISYSGWSWLFLVVWPGAWCRGGWHYRLVATPGSSRNREPCSCSLLPTASPRVSANSEHNSGRSITVHPLDNAWYYRDHTDTHVTRTSNEPLRRFHSALRRPPP